MIAFIRRTFSQISYLSLRSLCLLAAALVASLAASNSSAQTARSDKRVVRPVTTVRANAPTPSAASTPGFFGGSIDISRANSVTEKRNGTDRANLMVDARLVTRWSESYESIWNAIYLDDLRDEKTEPDLLLGRWITAYKGWEKRPNSYIGYRPSFVVGFPVNKSQRMSSLKASVGGGIALIATPKLLGSRNWSARLRLNAVRNWVEFVTSETGEVNTEWLTVQALNTDYKFTEQWSAGLNFELIQLSSYRGEAKYLYTHGQTLSFDWNKNLGFSVGHALGDPWVPMLTTTDRDLNIVLTDKVESMFVVGMKASF